MRLTATERKTGTLSKKRLAEAVRTFRDSGILLIENAYDLDFIQEVRDAYDAALEKHLDSMGGLDTLEGKTFGKNHIGFFPPLFPPIGDVRIAAHPIAVQLMTELLGKDLQCSFYHTNTACPGSGLQPVHRDSPPLFGTEMQCAHPVTALVLNIPLCDFNEENGSTEVWPGTHLIVDSDPEEGRQLEARVAHLPSIRFNMKVGSFALRDLRVWHRGMPNRARYARTMFALVYMRGWLSYRPINIPQSVWESWSEEARHIFRRNKVVEDAEHNPMTWADYS